MNQSRLKLAPIVKRKPIRVIYIAGAGRSGSTVLDTVLGNHADVFSVGELENLHRSSWTQGEYCACGERGNRCAFWTKVYDEWTSRCGDADVSSYIALQRRFERIRRGGRILREMIWPSTAFQQYLNHTYELFAAISEVSERRVIVDSSKTVLRASLLALVPGIDLRLVHLVRDARGVAWSKRKPYARDEKAGVQRDMKGKPAWKTALNWTIANSLCGCLVRLNSPHAVRIRYEDFVRDPVHAMNQIGQMADIDLDQLGRAAACGEPMSVGHTVAGNRLRMSGAVKLRADWEWVHRLPLADRRRCWAIAGWLLRSYGYVRQPDHETESESSTVIPTAA